MKKVFAVMVALVLATTFVPMAFAADTGETIIWSANDLYKINNDLSGNYILSRDIDMSQIENFTPIGSEDDPFTGTFDGNGHEIKNLKINMNFDRANGDTPISVALFDTVSSGTIKNLSVTDAYILCQATGYTTYDTATYAQSAGIAGILKDGGLIENCTVSGTVAAIGYYYCFARSSGIAICTDSDIINCKTDALVFGASDYANTMVGGISAWSDNSIITNCCTNGKMYCANTTGFNYAGGMVGSGNPTIKNSAVLISQIEVNGATTAGETPTTDCVSAFGSQENCIVSEYVAQILPNKGSTVISDEQLMNETTYTSLGWNFNSIWEMSSSPILKHESLKTFITEADGIVNISYNNTVMTYSKGVFIIGGTDSIPDPNSGVTTPIGDFSDSSKVIIIEESVPHIERNAFSGFSNVEFLILKGSPVIDADAFADLTSLAMIYFSDSPTINENAFSENISSEAFIVKENTFSEQLPEKVHTHYLQFNEGELTISGTLSIDAYSFFDLSTLLCDSFDNISQICIEKFSCSDLQLYAYNEETSRYELISDYPLTNVCIKVSVPNESDYTEITWNDFCDMRKSDEIETFRLIITSDEYSEIDDSLIKIEDEEKQPSFIAYILKFFTALLNKLFKLFSK